MYICTCKIEYKENSMAHAKKMTKRHKVVPCTDANQHERERAARKAKQKAYEVRQREKLMEEYQKMLESRRPTANVVTPAQLETSNVSEADVVNA